MRPRVDFPHPLSPTRPIVWPRRTRKLTPSTARANDEERPKNPDFTGKNFETLSAATSVRGRAPSPVAPGGGGAVDDAAFLALASATSHVLGADAAREAPRRDLAELR